MKKLDESEVILIENLTGVTQTTLRGILYKFLKKYYKKTTYDTDFLIAEGDIPIVLVAHMDTVFKKPAIEIFYDRKKNVMWSPTGAGFDDRAGVYAIIKIVEAGYRPHIVFTTDEEIGCVGAAELSYLPCPFDDIRYVIQLDRRGANDCVFYECANEEFEKYVEKFGFVTNFGSFTDICELCPAWGAAGVNLSIGYRDEHTTSEVLFVGQMLDTIEKVKKMLSETDIPKFEYVSTFSPFHDWGYGYYPYDDDLPISVTPTYPPKESIRYKCSSCGKMCKYDEVLEVKLIRGGKGYFCEKCMEKKLDWCWSCGEAYEINTKDLTGGFCPDCRKKLKNKIK